MSDIVDDLILKGSPCISLASHGCSKDVSAVLFRNDVNHLAGSLHNTLERDLRESGIMASNIPVADNNRLGLNYELEALKFPERAATTSIIDVHTHLRGKETTALYEQMARRYGVSLTYSMTPVNDLSEVKDRLGNAVRFIAFPDMLDVMSGGKIHSRDWIPQIEQFHQAGARMIKFWAGPRGVEYEQNEQERGRFALRAPHRIEAAKVAAELGMCTMVHVGDPDFWFAKRYSDESVYGSKPSQYEPLKDYLGEYSAPCIAAHMGGWPENLEFLDSLLKAHPHLYLDMSATKWMVRELSRHNEESLVGFLTDWKGRILFGSDIVLDDGMLACSSKAQVLEMVGSRYWSYRTMLETGYDGESPISDPDTREGISMIKGRSLPDDVLSAIYHEAAHAVLEPVFNPEGTKVASPRNAPLRGAGTLAVGS